MVRKGIIGRFITHIKKSIRHYLSLPKSKGKTVIVMIDGEMPHGGLTDRFRHIMSIYSYCKTHSLKFKLYYIYPCNLEKILLPNSYDWRISKKNISYSFIDSKEILIYAHYKSAHISKKEEIKTHLKILNSTLSSTRNIQYHIYGNCYFAEKDFSSLFNELFKPSPLLQTQLDILLKSNMQYEAVVLRFQQLLGDFIEGNFPILDKYNRYKLINKCIEKIKEMYLSNYFSTQKILITSDSSVFLEYIKKELDFCFIIPGRNIHMDFVDHKENDNIYIKSFIDLFMLSRAKKITSLKTSIMYDTGFPEFAAQIGNITYNKIVF